MKVIYLPDTIDCTADPHPVRYEATVLKALDDVVKVCSSPLVFGVRSVEVTFEQEKFESDQYEDSPIGDGRKGKTPASGPEAKKYKTCGLYWYQDAEVDARHHLPIGLSGVKMAAELIKKRYDATGKLPSEFHIRIVWAFAMAASCSDFIDVEFDGSTVTVDYSNQDTWISREGYPQHCSDLSALIGQEITPSEGE